MPTMLREATRTARKVHHCGMCGTQIKVGQQHHVSTNIFDDRVYDFRTCAGCQADRITTEVYDWAGAPDEGVGVDTADEWAHENADYTEESGPMARRWLARYGCDCESCAMRTPPGSTTSSGGPR